MKTILLSYLFFVSATTLFAKVDYVRVMFNRNADHRATIGWHQVSGDQATVFWGKHDYPASKYLDYENVAHVVTSNEYKGMNNQFVRLLNLDADQAYYFVIKDSEGISERYWFKTTPDNDQSRLSLIAGGDSRSRREPRQKAFNLCGKLIPHAILFAGDYTDIDTEEKWKWWMEDYMLMYKGFDNRIIPIVTVRGNHEDSNRNLVNIFDCPSEDNYYSVTMGGDLLNVINLNTEISMGWSQKKFLEENLIEHVSFSWQLPVYHRACRPHVKWKLKARAPKLIYRKWIHLFERHGVKLVIECDSHITKTTWPIKKSKEKGSEEGFIRDDANGIVYAGEGCWGAPLRTPDKIRSWTRDADKINSFKWLFVDRNQISMRTINYWASENVEQLTDKTRFHTPKGLVIWEPENGAEVVIKK